MTAQASHVDPLEASASCRCWACAGNLGQCQRADASARAGDDVSGTTADTTAEPRCEWCGEAKCAQAFDHRRLAAGSETTWRRAS